MCQFIKKRDLLKHVGKILMDFFSSLKGKKDPWKTSKEILLNVLL
ncbi:hypothetical protein RV11_GL000507 [Enterococcus phoeniculicola]|nr:hypothetical protein RV11_GL000507 [Enterococcus phoeniculicola]